MLLVGRGYKFSEGPGPVAVPVCGRFNTLKSILAVGVGLCALVLRSWTELKENWRFLNIAVSEGLNQKLFGLNLA
jgi:hypothetical protein